jgi:hypothetical protein
MADVSATLGKGLSIVVITPSTDPTWLNSLAAVRHRASMPSVILLDQHTFGGPASTAALAAQLATAGMMVHTVKRGQEFRTISVDKKAWEQQRRGRMAQATAPAAAGAGRARAR